MIFYLIINVLADFLYARYRELFILWDGESGDFISYIGDFLIFKLLSVKWSYCCMVETSLCSRLSPKPHIYPGELDKKYEKKCLKVKNRFLLFLVIYPAELQSNNL